MKDHLPSILSTLGATILLILLIVGCQKGTTSGPIVTRYVCGETSYLVWDHNINVERDIFIHEDNVHKLSDCFKMQGR